MLTSKQKQKTGNGVVPSQESQQKFLFALLATVKPNPVKTLPLVNGSLCAPKAHAGHSTTPCESWEALEQIFQNFKGNQSIRIRIGERCVWSPRYSRRRFDLIYKDVLYAIHQSFMLLRRFE
mmetsp:Transcript_115828/g.173097  ORF Transcript_115828/g.173097 Transcript_115828/m.173097 type:complete len:122 (-) Transcript_115828:449-814(-)